MERFFFYNALILKAGRQTEERDLSYQKNMWGDDKAAAVVSDAEHVLCANFMGIFFLNRVLLIRFLTLASKHLGK